MKNEKLIQTCELKNEIDEQFLRAIESVDLNGPYQKKLTYILLLTIFCGSMILLSFPVHKEIPEFFCVDLNNTNSSIINYKSEKYIFIYEKKCVTKYCKNSVPINENLVLIVNYESNRNFISLLDLMCEMDDFSGEFSRYVFFFRMFSTIFIPYISDKYGRLHALRLIFIFLIFSNIGLLLFRNKQIYLIFCGISNMALQGYSLTTVISVETMSLDLYSTFNGFTSAACALPGLISVLIMLIFSDWLVVLMLHLLINVYLMYQGVYYITETPMFHLKYKQYEKLKSVLFRISEVNNTEFILKSSLDKMKIEIKSEEFYPDPSDLNSGKFKEFLNNVFGIYIKIFLNKKDFMKLLYLTVSYIAVHYIYYGTLLYVDKIPGNIKINSSIIFSAEIMTPFLTVYLLKRYPRRKILITFYFIVLIPCVIFINLKNSFLISVLLIIISYGICVNFIVVFVYAAEVFDTDIKSSASGILLLVSNLSLAYSEFFIGMFISPFSLFTILCGISIITIYMMDKENNFEDKLII